MRKTINNILKIFTSVLAALAVLLAILLVGVRLFGLQIYVVLSGSMEPEYHTGSLIYVKEMDPTELEVNDVITFKLTENTTATHRIIELVPDEENPEIIRFRTKGDANDTVDASLVDCENVIGTPVFTIPYLGYVARFIQQPPGLYIAIAISTTIILLVLLTDITIDEKKRPKKGEISE